MATVEPTARHLALPTAYVRRMSFSGSLRNADVAAYGTCMQEEFIPVALNVQGVRSVTFYSGASVGIRLTSMLTREGYDDVVKWWTRS
jgi:hypothetical protein